MTTTATIGFPKPGKTVKKKRKNARSPRAILVEECDDLVREILWLTEKRCITCGVEAGRFGPNNRHGLQVGHYKSRTVYPLKWNLKNCHLQCSRCNYNHENDSLPYTLKMLEKYGKEGLEELQKIHDEYRVLNKTMPIWKIREIEKELLDLLNKMKKSKE